MLLFILLSLEWCVIEQWNPDKPKFKILILYEIKMDVVQSRTQGSNPEETSIKFQAFMVWGISTKILQPFTSDIRVTSEEIFEK